MGRIRRSYLREVSLTMARESNYWFSELPQNLWKQGRSSALVALVPSNGLSGGTIRKNPYVAFIMDLR